MHSENVFNLQSHRNNKMFQPETQYYASHRKLKHSKHQKFLSNDSETKSNIQLTCQENFNQYLMNSTLHGLRYVGDRSITHFER